MSDCDDLWKLALFLTILESDHEPSPTAGCLSGCLSFVIGLAIIITIIIVLFS